MTDIDRLAVHRLGITVDGRPLWTGVSTTLDRGSTLAVVGPNGSGKSTLLACLAGLRAPDEGRVTFGGTDVTSLGRARLRAYLRTTCGVLLQRGTLVPDWTVAQNVGVVRPAGLSRRDRAAAVHRALTMLDLDDRAGSRVGPLSGGEQQRVGLARLVAQQPRLVVADEPTSALDDRARGLALTALAALRDAGTTVVVATHDPVVVDWCDAVLDPSRPGDGAPRNERRRGSPATDTARTAPRA
jgi:ABC-type lipoprotein export system ATPase subunit